MEHLPTRFGTDVPTGIGRKPCSGSHTRTHGSLTAASLTLGQHKNTCGYWFVVTEAARAHAGFATREQLLQWLNERALTLAGELADARTCSTVKIAGEYRSTEHWSYDEFYTLDGRRTRVLSNADYTMGIITNDDDGIANVHLLNCNLSDRLVFDYGASRTLFG